MADVTTVGKVKISLYRSCRRKIMHFRNNVEDTSRENPSEVFLEAKTDVIEILIRNLRSVFTFALVVAEAAISAFDYLRIREKEVINHSV